MKNRILDFSSTFFMVFVFLFGIQFIQAQCPNDNSFVNMDTLSVTEDFEVDDIYNIFLGEYAVAKVVEGETYVISTCPSFFNNEDINMTLYSEADGSFQGFNDDYCGQLPEIIYNATFTGNLRILLDQDGCTAPLETLAEGGPDQGTSENGYDLEIVLLPSEYKIYQGVAIEDYVVKFLSPQDTVIRILSDTEGEIERDTLLNNMEFTYTLEDLDDRFYLLDILSDISDWRVIFRNPNFEPNPEE